MNKNFMIETISIDQYPEIYGKGIIQGFISQIKDGLTKEVPDVSTIEGRQRIASLAAKISRSKSAVERPGRDYLRQIKAQPRIIEKELREFVQAVDAIRDEIRQPLTDWEKEEDARIAIHESNLEFMKSFVNNFDSDTGAIYTSKELTIRLDELKSLKVDDSWNEYKSKALSTKDTTISKLTDLIEYRTLKEEKWMREEKVKKAEVEKQKTLETDRIKKEAIEGERKRVIVTNTKKIEFKEEINDVIKGIEELDEPKEIQKKQNSPYSRQQIIREIIIALESTSDSLPGKIINIAQAIMDNKIPHVTIIY